MSKSIFEIRKANVRYGDGAYQPLHENLQTRLMAECEKIIPIQEHLCLRWDVTETVLHDEDTEAVADDYPVLLIEVEIIFKDKLWVYKRCPYIIVVDRVSIYAMDTFLNTFYGGILNQNLDSLWTAKLIASTLNK